MTAPSHSLWRRSGAAPLLALLLACGPSSSGDDPSAGSDAGADGEGCTSASCYNACPDGQQTTLTGRVLAPNGIDPIPGAVVYVPRGEPQEFPDRVSCELCSQITEAAIVSTITDVDGSFTLGPLPTSEGQQAGARVPVVSQKGRFRRVASVAIDAPCEGNEASAADTTLPSRSEGLDRVPEIAVVTGGYDVMECVLLNMGLENGAFDLYNGIDDPLFGGGTPNTAGDFDVLLTDIDRMKSYNVIFINCSNDEFEGLLADEAVRGNLDAYVASGGRLYVTDWSYDYVEQVPSFSPKIDFAPDASSATPEPANEAAIGEGGITTEALVHDAELAAWLRAVEAVTGEEIVSDDDRVHIEHFLEGWVMQLEAATDDPDTTVWLSGDVSGAGVSGELPLTTTFDYLSCGRVLYSSYHTLGRQGVPTASFPSYCSQSELSPQERVLMFLILHISDCIEIE